MEQASRRGLFKRSSGDFSPEFGSDATLMGWSLYQVAGMCECAVFAQPKSEPIRQNVKEQVKCPEFSGKTLEDRSISIMGGRRFRPLPAR
jgi:hypothetical protein